MKKQKKMLTLDDLRSFCVKNDFSHFSSKESGYKLRVQVPATFKQLESDETTLFADIKIMHEGRNRNGSALSSKAADHCMKTLAYKPLLANFTDVNGEWDFTSHDFTVEKDEDGNEYIEYQEKQIGCFTADKPYKEYDEEYDHTYIYGRVAIPREYTRAAEIIERKGGTKTSAELEILEMSYNSKESFLSLDDAILIGCTCLGVSPETGEELSEGMIDSHISLESFSENNNALFTSELLDELKKFNKNFETIQFSKTDGKEEESMDQNNTELLEEEGLNIPSEETTEEFEETSEGITETEDTTESTEESTEEFSENTENEEDTPSEEFAEDDSEGDAEEDTEDQDTEDEDADDAQKYSLTLPDGTIKEFSLSLNDIQIALGELVNDTYGELDNDYYAVDVYPDDSKVVMMGWFSGACYRQSYKRKKDNFSLDGERVSVHSIWVSEDEEKALNEAKANFAEVSEKLAKYEAEPEKMEILESDDYENISETEEFAKLKEQENHFDLSVDDVKAKADELLLNYAKGHQLNFAANEEKKTKKVVMKGLLSGTGNRKGRYGNLFSK